MDAKDVVRHGRTASGVRRAGLSLHGVLFRFGAGTALQVAYALPIAAGEGGNNAEIACAIIRIALRVRKVSAPVPDSGEKEDEDLRNQ